MINKLSLDRVSEILRLQNRSIKDYVEKGLLPKPKGDDNDLWFSESALLKKLNLENFDEPFLTGPEVCKEFEISVAQLSMYRKSDIHQVPFYRLGDKRGHQILYRKSELIDYFTLKLISDSGARNFEGKWEFFHTMLERFLVIIEESQWLGLSDKEIAIFRDVFMKNKSIKTIAGEVGLSDTRVQQILNEIKSKLHSRIRHAALVYQQIESLRKKNSLLEKENKQNQHTISVLYAENNTFRTKLGLESVEKNDLHGLNPVLSKKVTEFEFSVRTLKCFENGDVKTLGDIIKHSKKTLYDLRNFGKKSYIEVLDVIEPLGLELEEDN